MLIDLQVHTIATPGHATWEPDALMRYAQEHGVGVVSVTDHNTLAQVPAALEAADQHGVHRIPAVELDMAFGGKLWYLLLYGSAIVERCWPLQTYPTCAILVLGKF